MPKIGFIYSEEFTKHETGNHPECPDRLHSVVKRLKKSPINPYLDWLLPQPASTKWIDAIHTSEYRKFIEEACLSGKSTADFGETLICEESYQIALLASGAAMQGVDLVMKNDYKRVFVGSRPPGHHARPEQAMGFCLFNHIAIAANYARMQHGLDRICIFDWDVHHGNGSQEVFYQDSGVLFCSIHQLPLYPHTGEHYDTGLGPGKGFNMNSPVQANSTLKDYKLAWQEDILPKIKSFKPQLILLSAGFDAHKDDPLAQIQLETKDFATMTNWALDVANEFCNGKLVSILEGGYNLEALAESVEAHLEVLIKRA